MKHSEEELTIHGKPVTVVHDMSEEEPLALNAFPFDPADVAAAVEATQKADYSAVHVQLDWSPITGKIDISTPEKGKWVYPEGGPLAIYHAEQPMTADEIKRELLTTAIVCEII